MIQLKMNKKLTVFENCNAEKASYAYSKLATVGRENASTYTIAVSGKLYTHLYPHCETKGPSIDIVWISVQKKE